MREPEILKAFATGWSNVTGHATLLPGGMHEARADVDNLGAAGDFGVITAKEQGIARNTNGGPIREHLVTVDLYTLNGLTSLATAQDTVADRSTGLASKLPPHTALDNGGYIVDLFPAPTPSGGQTISRRQGKMVGKVSVCWRVQSRWSN